MVLAAVKPNGGLMVQRSEDEILMNEGLFLVFNGQKYPFKERTIRRNKEWFAKLVSGSGLVLEKVKDVNDIKKLEKVISAAGYDQIAKLIVDYTDGAVTVEQIEEGTRTEILAALKQVKQAAGFFDLMWGLCQKVQDLTN